MHLIFHLGWLKAKQSTKRFKSSFTESLFQDYVDRISHFCRCSAAGSENKKEAGTQLWICDRAPNSKMLTSEQLADRLQKAQDQGTKTLSILIGGADGYSEKEIHDLKPDLRWSFGPLTLPHELAAVVASEQIYRAWTILRHLPYHTGH